MNQAMLAKASWRIVQNDKGLWCKIFKNKYLQNSSFPQNYKKPAAVSNIWSSITHGSHLLMKGLKWRIGNGNNVNFWNDCWTDFSPLNMHALPNISVDLSVNVCDFWTQNCWNTSKLSEYLPLNIVEHISAIPISYADDNDNIIWGPSSNGVFSVKSAYNLNFSDMQPTDYPWTKIWSFQIPPKLKTFLWTATAKKLLTNEHRMHKKFTSDPSCFHCPGTTESLLHLYRDCPKARMVWKSIFIPPSAYPSFFLNWDNWLKANLLLSKCSSMNIPWNILFSFTCWYIWKWRCKCIFDSTFNLPYNMRTIILDYIKEWTSASKTIRQNPSMHTVSLHWTKPPVGTMKINVDGSCNSTGCIGAGGIMRDYSGAWKGGFMINLGSGSILLAEVWAIFYGLQLALQYGQQNIVIESDSVNIIKLLTKKDNFVHPLGTIIKNCQSLVSSFSSCSFLHILREENFAVDFLAKASLKEEKGIKWLEVAPPDMNQLILDDIAGFQRTRNCHTQFPPHPSRPPNVLWNAANSHADNIDNLRMQRYDSQINNAEVNFPVHNDPLNATNADRHDQVDGDFHTRSARDTHLAARVCNETITVETSTSNINLTILDQFSNQCNLAVGDNGNLLAPNDPPDDVISNMLPSPYG